MRITPGGPGDIDTVLGLLGDATAWLVSIGRTGQWGTQPRSANPRAVAQITEWAEAGRLHLAHLDGQVAGALGVGAAMHYVPPATEPELYVNLLVTGRAFAGRGVGARLLDHAREMARERGAHLLRVDCYAGGDRKLVRYYEGQGFTATDTFAVSEWPGQVLVQRLRSG
ncbi:GNAT family N-acetyltransferase [Phytohabitans flavus]|uniref:GNAT family N-acetyltransferase n=1 Tax=Phytohabitans flavus TaxID=1076124 RepID=UPI00363FEF56